jgi:putative endonuclease
MFRNARTKTETGTKYEQLAERHLLDKGYRLLGRNVRVRGGEIDLLFEDWGRSAGVLVFVEVRMRDPRSFETPEESLGQAKRERLRRAAIMILSRYRGNASEVRFDLVAVSGSDIRHHEDFIRE